MLELIKNILINHVVLSKHELHHISEDIRSTPHISYFSFEVYINKEQKNFEDNPM